MRSVSLQCRRCNCSVSPVGRMASTAETKADADAPFFPNRFKGQVAVVTGGARGIGFAIATRLLQEGAHVALLDLGKDALADAVASLQKQGLTSVSSYVTNVADFSSVEANFEAIYKERGSIDVLVQSAGIVGATGKRAHEVDVTDFLNVLNINTVGTFHCCKAAIPFMLKNNYGRIVNIASIAGKEGNAGMLAYSASKAAVIGLTKTIGKDYADTGITCNAIAPGVVKTAMVAAMPKEQVEYMTAKIPMQRCGTLEEMAAMVLFIASKEASFTTGFTFDASGGRATY